MKTPCVNVCVLDEQRGLCKGCCRTLDEIARWSGMSDQERDAILAALPERRRGEPASDVAEVPVPPLA